MEKTPSPIAVSLVASLLVCLLTGCGTYTADMTSDSLWFDGQMSTVIDRQYRDPSLGSHSLGGGYDPVVKNDWILDKHPFPAVQYQPRHHTRTKFYNSPGEPGEIFLSISGSDLLIHQFPGSLGRIAGQFALFDPKTGRDVSALFPPASSATVFNRSRTKCVTLVDRVATILDVLSATNGSPNKLPRPSWTVPLIRLQNGGIFAHLSEDASYLVMAGGHSGIEAWTTNQNFPRVTISTKGNGEVIDADSVNGELLILARRLISPPGAYCTLKILNKDGETEHSTEILASNTGVYWDPLRCEVLIPPDDYIWDYH